MESGNPESWDQTNPKIKILKIKIRVAQNVGKVWISRTKILLAPFAAISGEFVHGPENAKNTHVIPIFLGGSMARKLQQTRHTS